LTKIKPIKDNSETYEKQKKAFGIVTIGRRKNTKNYQDFSIRRNKKGVDLGICSNPTNTDLTIHFIANPDILMLPYSL